MSLYPFVAAHLNPDDPILPPEPPCARCGCPYSDHIDVWADGRVTVYGAGCQRCHCAIYREPPALDERIAAVRGGIQPEWEVAP